MGEGWPEGENRAKAAARLGVVEYTVERLMTVKTHLRRVLLGEFAEQAAFDTAAGGVYPDS